MAGTEEINMKNLNLNGQKIKIILALVVSLVTIKLFSNIVFIANTPQLNRKFISQIQNLPKNIVAIPHQLAALFKPAVSQNIKQTAEDSTISTMQAFVNLPKVIAPTSVIFKPLVKGVYAGEDNATKTKYVTIEKGTKVQVYEFKATMKDGTVKNMKFIIPVK